MRTEEGEACKVTYGHQVQQWGEATERDLKNLGQGVFTFTGSQGVGPNALHLPVGLPSLTILSTY